MTRDGTVYHLSHQADVTCWCEARMVAVPWSWVRAGRTRSCGHPWCDRIEREALT